MGTRFTCVFFNLGLDYNSYNYALSIRVLSHRHDSGEDSVVDKKTLSYTSSLSLQLSDLLQTPMARAFQYFSGFSFAGKFDIYMGFIFEAKRLKLPNLFFF